MPQGDQTLIDGVSEHIAEHLGPISIICHEKNSPLVHIDVYRVDPTPERNWYTLVTSGMSQKPMNGPIPFAELCISLPPDWSLSISDFKDPSNYWPVEWLKRIARLPHRLNTWIGPGHTVPNGDPAEPVAPNTDFCCMLVTIPLTTPKGFWTLSLGGGREICLYAIVPLFKEEMEFKLKHGAAALYDRLEVFDVLDIVDLNRPNVCWNTP